MKVIDDKQEIQWLQIIEDGQQWIDMMMDRDLMRIPIAKKTPNRPCSILPNVTNMDWVKCTNFYKREKMRYEGWTARSDLSFTTRLLSPATCDLARNYLRIPGNGYS